MTDKKKEFLKELKAVFEKYDAEAEVVDGYFPYDEDYFEVTLRGDEWKFIRFNRFIDIDIIENKIKEMNNVSNMDEFNR